MDDEHTTNHRAMLQGLIPRQHADNRADGKEVTGGDKEQFSQKVTVIKTCLFYQQYVQYIQYYKINILS